MHLSTLLGFTTGLLATTASALPALPVPPPRLLNPAPRADNSTGSLVVYWGIRDDPSLLDVCNDPSYGIVNLSFLDKFSAGGGYPSLTLAGLWEPSAAQSAAGATDLKDGSALVEAIESCQSQGKLVILSLGGYIADVELADDAQGEEVADTLWALFGGGTGMEDLRPFGDVKLDGFDLDNESHNPTGYLAMTQRFKSNFASDSSKTYYMTAAPQCPFPDASQPLDVCQEMDYVWVQFYNNGDCNIAESGFEEAVRNWSEGIGDAKLYIGALASDADGDSGYVDAETLAMTLEDVQAMGLPNYGGAMLWEAGLASMNGDYDDVIAEVA